MRRDAEDPFATILLMLVLSFCTAFWWFKAVEAKDAAEDAVAECADKAGTETGDEWKEAFYACWEVVHGED